MLLTISLEASHDTLEAAAWYEKKALFLGNRFLDDLQKAYDTISQFPEAFGFFNKPSRVRQGPLHHFPYITFITLLRKRKSGL